MVGTTGVRLGSVLFGEGYNVLCVEAVFCLIRQFCDRIDAIDSWLHRPDIDGPVNLQTMRPLDMFYHQSDTNVQQWIRAESGQPLYVNAPRQGNQDAQRELYQVQDWVRQVQRVLRLVIGELRSTATNTWRDNRAKELSSLHARLDEALRRPPLFQRSTTVFSDVATVVSIHPECVQTGQLVQQFYRRHSLCNQVSFRYPVDIPLESMSCGVFQQIIDCCTLVCASEPIAQPEDPLKWGGKNSLENGC